MKRPANLSALTPLCSHRKPTFSLNGDVKILRKCNKCGREALTESDLQYFKKDKYSRHGRENHCRECDRKNSIKNYYENHEARLAVKKISTRKYNKTHKEEHRLRNRKYEKNNPVKFKAQKIARRKIPLENSCAKCGATEDLARHHPDYSKPLEVVILCRDCHNQLHNAQPQEATA